MPFKLITNEEINFSTPQEMYQDYKNKKIENLYSYQSEIIDFYLNNIDEKDISIELPTGSGKTLVGLLIGEFRRRKFKDKVIYICPNNQLVYQTANQANLEYGIKTIPFVGSKSEYSQEDKISYESGEAIAITNYSSLFNCNPYFINADLIIFDDAHSAEDFILDNWTVKISKENDTKLYNTLIDLFQRSLNDSYYEKCKDSNYQSNIYDIDKVPNIEALSLNNYIIDYVNYYIQKNDTKISYSWKMIENNLKACNIFVTPKEINIRPIFAPTLSFKPFTNPSQRIYMSATLGKSGELEKTFGVSNICQLPTVNNSNDKSIGRRFFMFPTVKFKDEDVTNLFVNMNNFVERSLLIVSDNSKQDMFVDFFKKYTEKKIFIPRDIEVSKNDFIENENAIAIVANRFDGIDFPHDECRLETLYDLQKATNLQDAFLISRMGASNLFSEKMRIRLIQALGRCTRASTDYAVICIFGTDIMNMLINPKSSKFLNPELQAEIKFGMENAKVVESIEEYLNLMDVFLNNRSKWTTNVEPNIIAYRDKIIDSEKNISNDIFSELKEATPYEINAFYCIWKEDFENALCNLQEIFSLLKCESLHGYLGFWYYIAAYCSYNLYNEGDKSYLIQYRDYLDKAAEVSHSITWLSKLKNVKEDINLPYEEEFLSNIERLEYRIFKFKEDYTNADLKELLNNILDNLKSDNGDIFESAYESLGLWFGFDVYDIETTGSPDPNWVINQNLCITCECKIHNKPKQKITLSRVRQSITHKTWVDNNFSKLNLLKDSYKCITLYISNSKTIDDDVKPFGKDIKYLYRDDLVNWAEQGLAAINQLINLFDEIGDITWRNKAYDTLKQNKVTPNDFINLFKEKSLDSL